MPDYCDIVAVHLPLRLAPVSAAFMRELYERTNITVNTDWMDSVRMDENNATVKETATEKEAEKVSRSEQVSS